MSLKQPAVFVPAEILIPQGAPMETWSVVACDQYTSQPDYWSRVENAVGGMPSTLRLILPELYLERADTPERIRAIHKAMGDYLSGGVLRALPDAFVLTERTLPGGRIRRGVVGAVDLEQYDYRPGSLSPVRATEATVVDRIPPRVRVRAGAPLELPHVMLLIQDKDKTVIEPLFSRREGMEPLYDFSLMENGGALRGYLLPAAEAKGFQEAVSALAGDGGLLFAVGDGNHSLASAKAVWEEIKPALSKEEAKTHPARFALAEAVNLFDDALAFEPIHRVVFGTDPRALAAALSQTQRQPVRGAGVKIPYCFRGAEGTVLIDAESGVEAIERLQAFLDEFLKSNPGQTDYIHGEDVVKQLSAQEGAIGFLLPPMDKAALFSLVERRGSLPRKTFSMGHANEKRFYLECRKIKPNLS